MDQERWSDDGDVELVVETNPSRRRFGLLLVNLAVIAAAAVAGFYVLAVRDDSDARPPETTVPSSSTSMPTVEDVLAIMPASPIDGKESQKLPVAVVPQSDLVDGQFVNVVAKGFQPGERVGAVLCIAEAALEGVTACDLGTDGGFDHVTYSNATAEGFVQVDVPVRATIVTPFSGPVDCLSGPERCLVAVGAVGDYDRSGGAAIGFVGQPAFPVPTFAVAAPGPYVPDQLVDVIAAGLVWPREVQVQLCAGEQCVALGPRDALPPTGRSRPGSRCRGRSRWPTGRSRRARPDARSASRTWPFPTALARRSRRRSQSNSPASTRLPRRLPPHPRPRFRRRRPRSRCHPPRVQPP